MARGEFDVEVRHNIIREIDQILFEETPYVLLWHLDHTRLLYWNKFGMPDHVLGKFDEEWAAVDYWWNDEFMAEDLEAARESGSELPPPPREVIFDEVFQPGVAHSLLPTPLQ